MGKLVYRMCLFVILVIAVAGGIYYYMTIYQKELLRQLSKLNCTEKGTFVKSVEWETESAAWSTKPV